ncbi:hypothetical protein [Curtobacterium sp. MCBD17_003]|uniref:hypothetical protein n=1 Tax=Curtobacterium sp. MCBD17_003 TaxID=2175667 RepID=UPI000DA8A183|nr:hypothetical protein [Curtobacterium sp. MCBD17_003]WIE55641.1 hypothetical protein DEI88_005425 [Curtobacterium sp. MCBD17_003]
MRAPALFSKVARWRRDDIVAAAHAEHRLGEIVLECEVWIAFDARAVAFAQSDAKETHGGIFTADYVLANWIRFLEEPGGRWIISHLQAMARGEDVRRAVLADYERLNGGGEPETVVW